MFRSLLLFISILLGTGCKAEGGEFCTEKKKCAEGLICWESRCRTPAAIEFETKRRAALYAEIELNDRKMARQKEANLLRQSGVEVPQTVEVEPESLASAAPRPARQEQARLRVAHTRGKKRIFAACRSGEQLLSGGCNTLSSSGAIRASYPDLASGRSDTLGARWICEVESKNYQPEVEAYALCQALP